MKIAEFAKKFHVNKTTVRYYTESNLLIPKREKGYFDYDERCMMDMENIMRLKSFGFSINEIQLLTAYARFRKVYSPEEINYLHDILDSKIKALGDQLETIQEQIVGLKKYREDISIKPDNDILGIPFQAISHLSCPQCDEALAISNASIYNNMIYQGEFSCSCGSHLWIRDGIIVDDLDAYADAKANAFEHSVKTAAMANISNELISLIKRTGVSIANYLNAQESVEVVLFPTADSDLLIMDTDQIFKEGRVYLMASYNAESLIALKTRLEGLKPKGFFAFLHITNHFPVKRSIKHIVDNGGNICDLKRKKEPYYSFSMLKPLINRQSVWLSFHVGVNISESKFKEGDPRSEYLRLERYKGLIKDSKMLVDDELFIGPYLPPHSGDSSEGLQELQIRGLVLRRA